MRNKGSVAAGVGIGASLIAGLIAASRQARIAARQRDLARSEARKAEKVSRYLQKMLSSADPRVVGRDSRVVDILRMAAESVETEFTRQPEIAADLNTTIGLTYLGLGDLAGAEKYLKAALDTRLALFPRRSVKVATSLQNYGKLLSTRGDLKGAEPLFCEALEILESAKEGDEIDIANVLDDLGYLRAFCGDSESAISLHIRELDIRRRVLGRDHPDVARTMGKIGSVYAFAGGNTFSEPLLRDSLRILLAAFGPEHPDVAWTKINLVRCILLTEPDEAERLSREGNDTRLRLLGPQHPEVAWSLYNLSYVLDDPQQTRRSRRNSASYIGDARSRTFPTSTRPCRARISFWAGCCVARGSCTHALRAFEASYELRQITLPKDHWLLASTQSFLGECLIKVGEVENGRRLLQESFAVIRAKLGDDHEQTKNAFQRLTAAGLRPTA
jgi:tetratricopeptide (TPR) repeat protein